MTYCQLGRFSSRWKSFDIYNYFFRCSITRTKMKPRPRSVSRGKRPEGTQSIPSTAFTAPAATTAVNIVTTTAARPPAVSEVEMRLSTSGGTTVMSAKVITPSKRQRSPSPPGKFLKIIKIYLNFFFYFTDFCLYLAPGDCDCECHKSQEPEEMSLTIRFSTMAMSSEFTPVKKRVK